MQSTDKNIETTNFYINGNWVSPISADKMDVIDPSTKQICATISLAGKEDVDAAVGAAKAAFTSWSVTPLQDRLGLLEKTTQYL